MQKFDSCADVLFAATIFNGQYKIIRKRVRSELFAINQSTKIAMQAQEGNYRESIRKEETANDIK